MKKGKSKFFTYLLISLFVLSFFIALIKIPTVKAESTFGYSEIGLNTTQPNGATISELSTLSENGNISAIMVYASNFANVTAGLYFSNGTRIALTANNFTGAGGDWLYCAFSTPQTLSADDYFLAASASEGNFFYTNDTGTHWLDSAVLPETLIHDYGTGTNQYSIYAIYEPTESSPISAESGYDYTMAKNDTATYIIAENNTIVTSNAEPTTAFASMMSYIASGGTWYVKSGTYTGSTKFFMNSINNTAGTFQTGAKFTINDWVNTSVLNLQNSNYNNFTNLWLDGNGFNESDSPLQSTSSSGFIITSGNNNLLQNSTIINCRRDGAQVFSNGEGDEGTYNTVLNCTITFCGWNSITFGGTSTCAFNQALNNTCAYNGDLGISTYGYNNTIKYNYCHDMNGTNGATNSQWGIAHEDGMYSTIEYNTIENCIYGINVDAEGGVDGNYSSVRFNTVTNCNRGIGMARHHHIVSYNTLTNCGTLGADKAIQIYLTTNLTVFNNNLVNCNSSVADTGVNTVFYNNTGLTGYNMLNVSVVGSGATTIQDIVSSTVILGLQFLADTNASVTWTPDAGNSRVDFAVDDVNQTSTTSPILILMDSDHSGTAYFEGATFVTVADWVSPLAQQYNSSTVAFEVSTVGSNDTGVTLQIQLYNSSVAVYGSNFTSASGTFTGLVNGSYTAAVSAVGDNGASDYKTVNFTVAIPPEPEPTPTPPTGGSGSSTGETYTVTIIVHNNSKVLGNAEVRLGNFYAYTDNQGKAVFIGVASGFYELKVYVQGQVKYENSVDVEGDKTVMVDLSKPNEAPVDVGEVDVSGFGFEVPVWAVVGCLGVLLAALAFSGRGRRRRSR
ncbi:MAG: right-handed parallel beta-helix repeat-containing protein [Candidatus Bathyarchaeia archaeon]